MYNTVHAMTEASRVLVFSIILNEAMSSFAKLLHKKDHIGLQFKFFNLSNFKNVHFDQYLLYK